MANKYPGWSPYNYVMDNPINNFDNDGNYAIKCINRNRFVTVMPEWKFNTIGVGLLFSKTIAGFNFTGSINNKLINNIGDNIFTRSQVNLGSNFLDFLENNFINKFNIFSYSQNISYLHRVGVNRSIDEISFEEPDIMSVTDGDPNKAVTLFIKKEFSKAKLISNPVSYQELDGLQFLELNPDFFKKYTQAGWRQILDKQLANYEISVEKTLDHSINNNNGVLGNYNADHQ